MAFGDIIQNRVATSASGDASLSIGTPIAGNLLVSMIARSATASGGAWNEVTGYTKISDAPASSGNMTAAWYYKVADGTETIFTAGMTTPAGTMRCVFLEIEGPFSSNAPLDKSAEDETNLNTVVTSQASGTTGTTTRADQLAIAWFAADSASNVDGGGTRNYSNSFTEVVFQSGVSFTARAAVAVAKRILTAIGTYSCTYSVTDTGDEMYGAIATFSAAKGDPNGSILPPRRRRFVPMVVR